MINEYDIVIAKKDLSAMVPQGTKGTVLIVFEKPKLAYEVEFTDSDHNFIELLTVTPDAIEKI